MYCTNCGETLEGTALFCTACGQKTENASAPPPLPPPAPPPQSSAPTGPLPGGAPMEWAPAAAPAKTGSSKLLVWVGVLVVLLAVTAGLAYVAFQRFIAGGEGLVSDAREMIAETETAPPEDDALAPYTWETPGSEEVTPEPELPEEQAEIAAPAPAPAPSVATAPTPKPQPKPIPTRPASTAPVVAPKPAPSPPAAAPPPPMVAPKLAPAAASPAPPAMAEPPAPPPASKGSKVLLSGSEAYSPPPPAPKPVVPGAPAAPTVKAAPTAGDVFWSGTLKKNQTVTVDYAAGAAGVAGLALPGKPVRLETFSPVVEIVELPGPDNGWKRFTFKAKRDAKKSVTLNFHWALAE